jgi:H+/Cl- antiporter ClcA
MDSAASTTAPTPAPVPAPSINPGKALALAIVLGIAGATAGQFFLIITDAVRHAYFTSLPSALGFDTPPWWYVILGLLVSAGVIVLARRLPGATGSSPLTGFHFNDPLRIVPGVLLAAFATLILGASLGPEAPTIVIGTTVGALLLRKGSPTLVSLGMFLAGMAAIGSIFGNPFVAAFMVLEFIVIGMAPKELAMPAFVALGAGYLVQVGWAAIPGFGIHPLSVPGLPEYSQLHAGDLLAGFVLAIVVAVACLLTRGLGQKCAQVASAHPNITVAGAALVIGIVASVAAVGFGVNYEEILYSGQSGIPLVVGETSLGVIVVILIARLLIYGMSLGSGFRGGPIFPACFAGVAFGVALHLLIPSVSVSPMAAVGIAAASAVMTGLPFTSGLLGMLLIGGAGVAIAPFAIVGAVVGAITRQIATRNAGRGASAPATH